MNIDWYFLCFIFYSFLGWIWETIYCTYMNKHFENRGFLFGPICPIYGVSVLILQIMNDYIPFMENVSSSMLKIFLLATVGSAIIEFCTSFYLEKRFNARWWDYSKLPFNIQGRIALPVSIGFGIAGILVTWYLLPVVNHIYALIPENLIEFLGLILAAIFGADFAATEASLSTLLQHLDSIEEEFTNAGEEVYQRLHEWSLAMSRRQTYVLKNMRMFGIRRKHIDLDIGKKILELVKRKENDIHIGMYK